MNGLLSRALLLVILGALSAVASEPASKSGSKSKSKATETPRKADTDAAKPAAHPVTGDRVVILHERLNASHVVATRRAEDLRSKEIMVGDGMEVTDIDEFLKSSRVRIAAIPVGTTAVVLERIEPWHAGNEVAAVKVGITSGPLDGQAWWISVPGVAVRKTAEGDRRIAQWEAQVKARQRREPRFARTYVSPVQPAKPKK
jgi:hypothetical protein